MLTDLDLAQREHMQAARHLRRLEQERQRQRAVWLDRQHDRAYQRWQASLERLRAAERATPPGGDGDRQHPNGTQTAPQA